MNIPKNIPKNPRKWVVIYGFKDGEAEYLSQAQYDIFMQAYNEGRIGVSIDGRPYRVNCITAKLARDYNYNAPRYHPEDNYEILCEKASGFTDEDRRRNYQNLLAGKPLEDNISRFCDDYNVKELKKMFFGGGEKNGQRKSICSSNISPRF